MDKTKPSAADIRLRHELMQKRFEANEKTVMDAVDSCGAHMDRGRLLELHDHYLQRLRDLMHYANHKNACEFSEWMAREAVAKARGLPAPVDPTPPRCTCGFASLGMIILAEVL